VFLALVLFALVIIVPSLIWPPKPVPHPTAADSAAVAESVHAVSTQGDSARPTPHPSRLSDLAPSRLSADTVWVTTPLLRIGVSTRGGTLVSARLSQYKSFAAGDSGAQVELVPAGRPFLGRRIAIGSDTLDLTDLSFAPSTRVMSVAGDPATLTL